MIWEIKYFNFIKIRITNYQLHNNISLVVVKKIIEVEEIQDNIIKLDNNIPKHNFIFLVPNKLHL
jgi:hypothetical protein